MRRTPVAPADAQVLIDVRDVQLARRRGRRVDRQQAQQLELRDSAAAGELLVCVLRGPLQAGSRCGCQAATAN